MNNKDDYGFLCFEDYIDKRSDNKEWIVITRRILFDDSEGQEQIKWSTLSVVMKNDPTYIEKIRKKYDWEIGWDFVKPFQSTERNEIEFDNYEIESNQIEIAPFIFEKHIADGMDFLIHPDFIRHHNLSCKGDNYVNSAGDEIIRFVKCDHIEIKSEYLRDYLHSKNLVLVRYHEHMRRVNSLSSQLLGKETDQRIIPVQDGIFALHAGETLLDKNKTSSMLCGKDIISPQLMLTT